VHPTLPKGKPPAAKEATAVLSLDLPAGAYRAEWINPRTGATDKKDDFDHAGGAKSVTSPSFTEDVALRMIRH
ncbi:MAG TPA: hypothetical protein VJB14_16710, partial [Planctomycetota bacterium]|nr:hypothetical protein [Planctomycetota bacterium]